VSLRVIRPDKNPPVGTGRNQHTRVRTGQAPWLPFQRELDRLLPGVSLCGCHDPQLPTDDWPALERLNRGFVHRNGNGKPLKFVAQNENLPFADMAYEARIWQHGLIATRPNWHDFFNALIWHSFPRSKMALNAVHWHEMQNQASPRRSPRRDALTLFDECGVLLLSESRAPLKAVAGHDWKALFARDCALWGAAGDEHGVRALTFGHAMLEKYLSPYVGMTAKAALVRVRPGFLSFLDRHPDAARRQLDAGLAVAIEEGVYLRHSHELAPLPLLGMPGWWLNRPPDLLENARYFRPPSGRTGERKIMDLTAH